MIAYDLGIFGIRTKHDLNLIRNLRNGFAHCQRPIRFNTPAIKGMCDNLSLSDIDGIRAIPTYLSEQPVEGGGDWYDKDHPRQRYVVCCYTIIAGLFHLSLAPSEPLLPGADLP
jgi:hypothetical protein